MGAYDQIKKAFQDLIAPEIHALRGDVRVVNEKIVALDQKVDAVDARLNARIDSLRNEMHSELRRVDNRIDNLDRDLRVALEIRERLAALEARRPA